MAAISLGNGEKLRKGSFVTRMGHPYAVGFRDGSSSASWGIVSTSAAADFREVPLSGTARNR